MEEESRIEKTTILTELDKISVNYKKYAESHKKLLEITDIRDHYYILLKESQLNNNLLVNFRETIK